VFRVQADVAASVAEALGVALGGGERGWLAERPTKNLAAYDAFLRGEEAADGVSTEDRVALRRAIRYYEQAVALDSTFALAWAQLSRARSQAYWNGPTAAGAAGSRQAAERALGLAPKRPEGHLALGYYYSYVQRDHAHALEQYAQGQQLAPKDARLLTGAAFSETSLGRAEQALALLRQAEVLDPRSVETARFMVSVLVWLGRYTEALAAADRALALAPGNLALVHAKVLVHLSQGDLPGARAVLRSVPQETEPAALVAYMATSRDLCWVLDDEQQGLLLRLSPGAFDDDRANWGLALAQAHALRGESALARAYADSARLVFEAQVREDPEDAPLHALLGVTLGYLGRRAEAIREGERGVRLLPLMKDAFFGGYVQHQLARIYLLVGEPERALDQLGPLVRIHFLSPGWLKIDPTFAPLRGNPRFERLVNGK
jgi:tetratricopeptide (TPR) repeat protein